MDMAFDAVSGSGQDSDDAELLAAYAVGDASAARMLTARLAPRVYAQAFRMLGVAAEAEDVTQDAMMRLWRIAPKWDADRAQVSTWLYRVAANLCTDRLRQRKRNGPSLDAISEPESDTPGAEEQLQEGSRLTALETALQSLPDRQRQAVVLRHIEGLGNPQIAEILEISVEAVESLTARGKRALAAILKPRRAELGYEDDPT